VPSRFFSSRFWLTLKYEVSPYGKIKRLISVLLVIAEDGEVVDPDPV
jgi:hypothetical protein